MRAGVDYGLWAMGLWNMRLSTRGRQTLTVANIWYLKRRKIIYLPFIWSTKYENFFGIKYIYWKNRLQKVLRTRYTNRYFTPVVWHEKKTWPGNFAIAFLSRIDSHSWKKYGCLDGNMQNIAGRIFFRNRGEETRSNLSEMGENKENLWEMRTTAGRCNDAEKCRKTKKHVDRRIARIAPLAPRPKKMTTLN